MKKYISILIPALCAAAVLLLLRFVFVIGYIPTESMEPTLEKGSYILGSRLYSELQVGDIIIFENKERLLVKRIAAIPGDEIEKNGEIVIVPDGCYYVLGDNAANSYDSRFWENPFVDMKSVIAKLLR